MDASLWLVRLVLAGLGLGLVALDLWLDHGRRFRISRTVLAGLSVVALIVMGLLALDHVRFPLHLEVMEGAVLGHFQRAAAGLPVYPDPAPDFVALAYNPLYYYVSLPFAALFGVSLVSLRLSAVVALAGCVFVTYLLVRGRTGSVWWGLIAAGLFAAAAGVMDMYLVTAHSDSWFLFMTLLGAALIDRDRGQKWDLLGTLFLVAGFWFKQHGALFAVAGVLFLTWRAYARVGLHAGLRRVWPAWAILIGLGPFLYLVVGPALFGPRFIYFTWMVPSQWSEFGISTLYRLGTFVLQFYALPAIVTGLYVVWALLRPRVRLNVIHAMAGFAGLSALMGALDGGSANNVFIPMGTWFLTAAVLAIFEWSRVEGRWRQAGACLALFLSFTLLLYNPLAWRTDPNATAVYADFLSEIESRPGLLYSPDISTVEQTDHFYPNAHWVALEDLVRGRSRETANQPIVRELLAPLEAPNQPAWILTNLPLEEKEVLNFLMAYYTLDTDFGERFAALSTQPGRFYTGYPRYLYRYTGDASGPS